MPAAPPDDHGPPAADQLADQPAGDGATPPTRFAGLRAAARPWRTMGRRPAWTGEVALAGVVSLLAFAVRLPFLQTIPRLTDETGEVAVALRILGGAHPLTLVDAYNGAHWAYLLAAVLRLIAFDPAVPRLFAASIGALCVGATYMLASALGDRRSGLIAALFMATSMAHVVLMSHVAWNNHATPLWVTLAVWLTALAFARRTPSGQGLAAYEGHPEEPRRGRSDHDRIQPDGTDLELSRSPTAPEGLPSARAASWPVFIAAGALWGMALASHPSVAAPLVGAAGWAVATRERRRVLGSRRGQVAALAFALVVSPLVVHSVIHPLAYLREAFGSSQPVAADRGPSALAANTVGLAGQLGRAAAAGPLVEPGDPLAASDAASVRRQGGSVVPHAEARVVELTDDLRRPVSAVYALILILALVRAAITGPRLVAVTALLGLASLPLVNRSYDNFYDTRYLGYVLPLAYSAMGLWLAQSRWTTGPNRSRLVRPAALVLVAAFAVYPLLAIDAYYQRETAAGRTNAAMLQAAAAIAAKTRNAPAYALVDKAMRPIKLGGGGDPTRAFDQLLALSRVPHDVADSGKMRWFLSQPDSTTYLVVVADATAAALTSEFTLQRMIQGNGWQVLARPAPRAAR